MNNETLRLLEERSFMTAGGTETVLYFQQQFPMREFCAFEVFDHPDALERLEREYLFPLMSVVAEQGHGLILDAMVWRAHPDYIAALDYAPDEITRINHNAVARTTATIDRWRAQNGLAHDEFPVLITADLGPRGDGYQCVDADLSVEHARDYHRAQVAALAETAIDLVCAWTITSATEAIGIVQSSSELDVPILISATVETDGRLPDGSTLGEFIGRVDRETDGRPAFYLVNCAHPTHLRPTLDAARASNESWLGRFRGFRANASRKSHEELDESTTLDRGDPTDLATQVEDMRTAFDLKIVGGCCGTDGEHIAAMARASDGRR